MNSIDESIFAGSDHPLDARDEIVKALHGKLNASLRPKLLEMYDRPEISDAEVYVSMLYRISQYYGNDHTTKEQATRWRDRALEFFDRHSGEYGDAEDEDIRLWRDNIRKNFNRLIRVLCAEDDDDG